MIFKFIWVTIIFVYEPIITKTKRIVKIYIIVGVIINDLINTVAMSTVSVMKSKPTHV